MRNCGCCKFKELSPAEFPCCDCGASNHWEAEEEAKKMRLEKDCDHCKHSDVASYEEPCINCCNPIDNWVDIDQPELAEDPEPEPVDISEMKVVNLDDGFSVLYGYGGMKILQQGTVLTDIYNPAIRAVLYKLIKKLEEEK